MEKARATLGRGGGPQQRGSSLVEVLLAILLVSVVMLGVMAGLLTTVGASATNTRTVTARSALVTVTEQLKHMLYWPCSAGEGGSGAAASAYQSALGAPPRTTANGRPITVVVDRVRYWDDAVPTPTYAATCPSTGDAGTQLIELTVEVADGRARGSVVVRNPTAVPR